ncbi:MAG: hypothetical protein KDH88_15570 [Chromatiales bacterium]|nr:hypothetical protein [Chromatiales bacterium]
MQSRIRGGRWLSLPLAALLAVILASCSAGGSGSGLASEGGIGGSGISVGPISSFGSVFVNGVRYDTEKAEIFIDGMPATTAELRVGMRVRVAGSLNADGVSGSASSVRFDSDVLGFLESVDFNAQQLVVLGQRVQIDDLTVFGGFLSLADLRTGDRLRVSGSRNVGETVLASRVERLVAGEAVAVLGIVSQLDLAASRFTIAGQSVAYVSAGVLDLPGGAPTAGQRLLVEGVLQQDVLVASRLTARPVDAGGVVGESLDLSGVITRFQSVQDFDVDRQVVRIDNATVFEEGVVADLALGKRIQVQGLFGQDDALLASRIEFRDASSGRGGIGEVELRGAIARVDSQAGSVTLLGNEVVVDNLTVLDDVQQESATFRLGDLVQGEAVEVRGYIRSSDGRIVAERLDREGQVVGAQEVKLEGMATNLDASNRSFTLLGVPVVATPDARLTDADDVPLAAVIFFERLAAGARVEVEGLLVGDTVFASELELQESGGQQSEDTEDGATDDSVSPGDVDDADSPEQPDVADDADDPGQSGDSGTQDESEEDSGDVDESGGDSGDVGEPEDEPDDNSGDSGQSDESEGDSAGSDEMEEVDESEESEEGESDEEDQPEESDEQDEPEEADEEHEPEDGSQ